MTKPVLYSQLLTRAPRTDVSGAFLARSRAGMRVRDRGFTVANEIAEEALARTFQRTRNLIL